ncbi:PIG-L family deacetylase [Luteolibacter pohnpeiensis]|uniref:PIG-L family deacetylase n=1 Tax=Luteolibacter pohnpeiensis TaxID=454153 RepID=A0A934S6Q6_9BACT|nr:PIG-L family deacetylase [Luteolibacter pohnpeiensis]MBK1882868.1 PIG-L family deacetylase [Luteolibacter pohnpeiensis]
MNPRTAIAIAAHPDDIEFQMAGTLLMLKNIGWEIHYFNLATGNGGSISHGPDETAAMRREESIQAAAILGAHWHPPIANDLEIFYNDELLRKVAAVVREVRPSIVLTHPLQDYMEDHMITARLAVTATFAHGIQNYRTDPPRDAYPDDVTVYHCTPHGGRDPLRKKVLPGAWTNTTTVHQTALSALAAHRSQKEWLDATQGMSSYLNSMEEKARGMGVQSGRFEYAEGWWRHLHTGFSATDQDPLAEVLGDDHYINPAFEASLEL